MHEGLLRRHAHGHARGAEFLHSPSPRPPPGRGARLGRAPGRGCGGNAEIFGDFEVACVARCGGEEEYDPAGFGAIEV